MGTMTADSGGEPACYAHLVCPECGGLGPDGHKADCGASRVEAMVSTRPGTTRIAPLGEAEMSPTAKALLAEVRLVGPQANIFATLVKAEGLFRRWLPFGGKLLRGKLPARDRELLILRTAWNCASPYEWGQHVLLARQAGLAEEEVAQVPYGPEAGKWSESDRTLLRAADELHETFGISDATWEALRQRYGEAELIELPMLVGHYHMVAMALNSLGVAPEPGLPAFPRLLA